MAKGAKRYWDRAAWLTIALLAAPLTGCGGGGNSGGSAPAPQTTTFTGTVLNSSGSPVAGASIVFDNIGPVSTVTNNQGQFTLTVPNADITGTDTLTAFTSQGILLQMQNLTASTSVTIIVPSAPPPPTNLSTS
jgi:hypothetical protein